MISNSEMEQILSEEIRRDMDFFCVEVLKEMCERGPPIPGHDVPPAQQLRELQRDTLPEEMAMVLDPDYIEKSMAGAYPEPAPFVWYALYSGQRVAGPFVSQELAATQAAQMGLPPNPDGAAPVEPKHNFWWLLYQLPLKGPFVPFEYYQKKFRRLLDELGKKLEARS